MAAHLYWRINILTNNGDGNVGLAGLEFRDTVGGSNVATGGTALCSNDWGGMFPAANAFDGNASTIWVTDAGPPQWIGYHFASAVDIAQIAVQARPTYMGNSPKDFDLQFSDDGAVWIQQSAFTGQTSWGSNETRTFAAGSPPGAPGSHAWWRVLGYRAETGTTAAIAEVEFHATVGGADVCSGGTPSASSVWTTGYEADKAFDNNNATFWVAGVALPNQWIAYHLAAAVEVVEFAIRCRADGWYYQCFKECALQYSDDGSAWTTVAAVSGQTGWTSAQLRTFTTYSTPPEADAYTTQMVRLALASMGTQAHTTQMVRLTVAHVAADVHLTEFVRLIVADAIPCLTSWAHLWRIARPDGTVFTFTSHDRDMVWRGETYQSIASLSASASELGAMLGDIGNMELAGVITDDSITEADLFGGLFDGAEIEVWMVPWDPVIGELPHRILAGRTGTLKQSVAGFSSEILTPSAQLQQKAIVQTYSSGCRWDLGDDRCTVDLEALTVAGTVTSSVGLLAYNQAHKRIFSDSSLIGRPASYFNLGTVTWLTGANAGLKSEVKSFDTATGQFILWDPMLYAVEIGDTFTASPGCDKLKATCQSKFSNFANFGGFPDVPGGDAISEAPNAGGGLG